MPTSLQNLKLRNSFDLRANHGSRTRASRLTLERGLRWWHKQHAGVIFEIVVIAVVVGTAAAAVGAVLAVAARSDSMTTVTWSKLP